jgi:hypothetical protein
MQTLGGQVQDAIHRYRFVLLAIYSVSFLAVVAIIAARRFFWYDEAFTLFIASLPTDRAIWTALAQAAENQPPLNFWLVHEALKAPIQAELSARLPAIVSFWLMTLCLYRIVARETHATYGLIAMLVPLAAPTVYFAYEARPYAPLLLLTAASVMFWQMARAGEHRPWSVILFGLALTGAVYLHYYGLLIYIPFAAAELVRGLRSREWDRSVWLAILLAGTAILPLVPGVMAAGSFTSMFNDPSLASVQQLYARLLGLPSVLFVLITLTSRLLRPGEAAAARPSAGPVLAGREGVVLLVAFCALPLVGFLLARLVTNAWADRYFLFTVVAFSIAFALLVFDQSRTRHWIAVSCLSVLVATAVLEVRQHYKVQSYRAGASVDVALAVQAAQRLPDGPEPLMLPGMLYLAVSHYSPPSVKRRLRFLEEDPSEHFSVAARRLAVISPLPIVRLEQWRDRREPFYVYKPSAGIMSQMRRLSLEAKYVQNDWYLVSPAPHAP